MVHGFGFGLDLGSGPFLSIDTYKMLEINTTKPGTLLVFVFFMMANRYLSREGLSSRPVGNSEEVQVRIDPVHADLDQQILGLHSQVTQLKTVALEIETEARVQNDLVSDLQMLMANAEARVKTGMRRLNRTISQQRSNHVLQVIFFGLVCFLVMYLWTKRSIR